MAALAKILKKDFFGRKTLPVCKELIGKFLVRRYKEKESAWMITEIEAYDGPHDKACHAFKGKTDRTKTMFGDAGVFYVYLVYGLYHMLNIVTDKKDYPSAILIRGVEGITGPGRVTKHLKIDKKLNGKKAIPANGLWIEDRGIKISKKYIKRTPRIGVNYAKEWAEKPYRFILIDKKNQ
ncbi:hypothetical protein A2230_01185 [candidate division WOR-1 bacterium RIFOXYA2_FULL_36_21]|uniref:Putative 3-methyladenine DNA glycosylase n=1 Tax=candidate division WOR-1 bacterium RIFOXYB2_FULL_36_35 TaxID=1802578 RepID=A0A1F4RYR9_UNCSA|nr:MAG: hypothetical protein A2230_01185 [candidate division WOR-1 bacterium RIFOXYA2_FULL_36_21]OGC13328.1 MAG: hypothetical protein A2290_04675 [candidate division WOR-1 bacterium RIFOXYB2_FULL_36_35]OGC21035.1 MAG: hypothetical protein A2282_08440 [candidate division WOR-1 bacterium RIFOXYA12_FULL_36_13]